MLAPSPRSPDVQYRQIYNLTVFDCPSLRATLQPTACAQNWADRKDGSACRGCPLGAIHAGHPEAPPPPPRPSCCRCGRNEQRLMAGVLCVSCFNRQREVLKGKNSKGKFPVQAGAKLRWAYAILQMTGAATALAKMTERHRTSELWTTGLKTGYLPGLPSAVKLDGSHIWLSAIATDQDELSQMVSRLLPGAAIVDSELSDTFAEKWRSIT